MALSEVEIPSVERAARGRVLVRNVSVLMASQVVTWGLSMVATVAIPRFLGPELVGRFHLANSIWAIGFIVTSFGMNLALTKAVARDDRRIGELLGTSIAARLLLCVPVTLGLYVYALAAGYPSQLLVLLAIVGVGSVVLTVTASISAVLQGLDRMGAMSLSNVLGRLAFVGGAVVLLLLGFSIYAVAVVASVGNLVTLVVQARALRHIRRELGDTGGIWFDRRAIVALLRESAPYFWFTLFIALYLQVDTIIISLVVETDEVLGWYSVYDRLSGTLLFVPTVFMTAVYPTMSRLYEGSAGGATPVHHARLTRKTFELMLLISVPAGLGLAVVARPLIELLFGREFSDAAPVVAVGGVVISLTYLTTVLGMFLVSMDRQREWGRFIALGALLTIPLDLVLVPYFQSRYGNGAIGGAVAYVVTETVILAGAIYLLPRGSLGPSSLSYGLRVVAAGLVMVVVMAPFRGQNLLVQICTGAVTYGCMTFVLRLISPEDKRLLLARVPSPLNRRSG